MTFKINDHLYVKDGLGYQSIAPNGEKYHYKVIGFTESGYYRVSYMSNYNKIILETVYYPQTLEKIAKVVYSEKKE